MVNTIERQAEAATGKLLMLDPRELVPDARNERGEVTAESDPELAGLVDSIKVNGVLDPLRVYVNRGKHIVSSGHRRRAAAILAGLQEVPCVVVERRQFAQAEIERLISNVVRKDINPVKLAITLKELREANPDVSQQRLAASLGMSQPKLANLLRLLKLPDQVLDYVADGRLSAGHGQALLRVMDHGHFSDWQGKMTVPEDMAHEYAMRWVANGTSVHEAEERVNRELSQQKYIKQSVEERERWRAQQGAVEASQSALSLEEMEAKRKEERRQSMVEGRARTKRVKAAQAAMKEALRVFAVVPEDGYVPPLDFEHVVFMALALNKGYMLADIRKAWGIPPNDEVEKLILETVDKDALLVICARLAMALMVEVNYDGKGFNVTAGWHSRDKVAAIADATWDITGAIESALRPLDGSLLMNQGE